MRIPDEFLTCVCFIGTMANGLFTFRGTGFFISFPSEADNGTQFIYLVTAKHCVTNAQSPLFLRLNTLDGGAGFVQVNTPWNFHHNPSSDLAVLSWAPDQTKFSCKWIPFSMVATDEVVKERGIGIGDDLFMTGLFVRHFGRQRNLPIVRTGIIAAMPEEGIRDSATGLDFRAYIAEVRSIGGLSGSPVFCILGPARPHKGTIALHLEFVLLGIVRGHWDEHVEQPKQAVSGSADAVNMGMAVITPADELVEIINNAATKAERKRADDARLALNAPTADHLVQ